MENHNDGIFLQETNHNNSVTLGNIKNWEVNMHTIFKNKTLGYGVGAFLSNTNRQDLINQDLEMVWTELEINTKTELIGNIFIPPYKTEQIHVLDRFLENQRHKAIIILGEFNAQNTLWNTPIKIIKWVLH